MIDNYLFLEEPIIDRIKSEVTGLKTVAARTDLASLAGDRQIVPAVYVIYLGDELVDGVSHQGMRKLVQTVTQSWAAVLTVNPADAGKEGKQARLQAGTLLAQLITALSGWKPNDAVTPFYRAAGRTAATYLDGYFYYPLIFQTNFVFPEVSQWKPSP